MADIMTRLIGDGALLTSVYLYCGIIIVIGIFYWLFYIPCNWTKQIDEVGYSILLKEEGKLSAARKRNFINKIRQQRKIGIKELPPPYPNGWYSLLESSQLKPGKSKTVAALGEQFVVFRTLENTVFVLDAYCAHMGANLGIGGRVIGDTIECPFHQWSFRGSDGKCANIPYSTCGTHATKVKKWISREVNDNIFVWYHAEIDQEPWMLPVVEKIESKEMVYHGRNEFYVNCHIQEIPENGADLAHFTAIHNDNVLAGGDTPLSNIFKNLGKHHWQAVWKHLEAPTKHIARVNLKHSIELTKNIHAVKMDVVADQVGPSYVQLHMKSPTLGCIEVLQTITPIEPMVQKVIHRFYAPRILGPFIKLIILGESIMFERDISIWNHKIYQRQPQLVKEDISLKLFRTWYSQFYSENSRTFREAFENLNW